MKKRRNVMTFESFVAFMKEGVEHLRDEVQFDDNKAPKHEVVEEETEDEEEE